jgi:site-specific DNA-methyltransferase (adenine-specific)
MFNLINGDSIKELPKIQTSSIDAIITDPPYGISFMNNKWDYDLPDIELWKQCLRILKPGGHLVSFSSARTYHRLVCNVEDAGFDIRDQSLQDGRSRKNRAIGNQQVANYKTSLVEKTIGFSKWEGWGTALKPAHEPIVLARKPLSEKNVVENVLKHNGGALNINACKIPTKNNPRFPANVIHDGNTNIDSLNNYFYCAKPSKQEKGNQNIHPTVKPLELMTYLCKLVTPKEGTILDPFMGSGTTGIASSKLNFNFIGIEKDLNYFEIAQKRIKNLNYQTSLF